MNGMRLILGEADTRVASGFSGFKTLNPFAMTINKIQGQTFSKVCMYLLCLAIRMCNFMLQCLEWGALIERTHVHHRHTANRGQAR